MNTQSAGIGIQSANDQATRTSTTQETRLRSILWLFLFGFLVLTIVAICSWLRLQGVAFSPSKLTIDPLQLELPGAHKCVVRVLSEEPRILLIENFLSREECEALKAAGEPKMKRSTVQGKGEDGSAGPNVLSKHRTSWTANLEKSQDEVVRGVESRAALLAGYPLANLEPLQIVRYQPKQEYKRHFDYFVPGTDGADEALKRGGQRRVTLFAYLNTLGEEDGGETEFTELNLKVRPVAGHAILFHNTTPDGKVDPRTAHAGTPPKSGVKLGCNVWIRERKFV
jgi:prolyl 4-hydroxylase